LDKLGCNALQGDCISPPLPAAEIETFASQWSRGNRPIVTPWREQAV
jgi:EAL domain-containing protein (putative c-di-GMP-specific phosphodiesterase class I)